MAAQRPTTSAAPRPLLLRGQRLETAGQMTAFVNDAVGLHLLGRYPYKNKDDLVAALNSADPNGAVWERQRLEYYVKKIRGKMLEEQRQPKQRRPAEGSPSDTDVTEGFGVGTSADNALNMEIFDTEPPAAAAAEDPPPPPPPNPLGGRPSGTTKEVSRHIKKTKAALVDSVSKAYVRKVADLEAAAAAEGKPTPSRKGLLKDLTEEKVEKGHASASTACSWTTTAARPATWRTRRQRCSGLWAR